MPDLTELQDASLGDIVRHLRKERGLTQFELGDELGKSQKWVSDIECGVYKHSTVETIRAIADFFDFPEHVLIIKAGFGKSRQNAEYILNEADSDETRALSKRAVAQMRADARPLIDKIPASDMPYTLMTLKRLANVR